MSDTSTLPRCGLSQAKFIILRLYLIASLNVQQLYTLSTEHFLQIKYCWTYSNEL